MNYTVIGISQPLIGFIEILSELPYITVRRRFITVKNHLSVNYYNPIICICILSHFHRKLIEHYLFLPALSNE